MGMTTTLEEADDYNEIVTDEEIEAEGKRIATDMFIDDQEDG